MLFQATMLVGKVAVGHGHHVSSILLAVAGLVGGFAVGLTGMGGGALMTPMLVLIFKIDPKVAVASDLVNSLVMKPIGGLVHTQRRTVQWTLVRWLVLGSVPAAFGGAFLLNQFGPNQQGHIKVILGWALLVASFAIVARAALATRARMRLEPGERLNEQPHSIKPGATVLIGVVGGVMVGMTSVGSGSLMIVLLMMIYPRLASRSLVGTDLVQAIPLVASAALGQLLFGHINFGLAGALVLGSVPGVYLGARYSARAKDAIVRPVLVAILFASALALLIPSNYAALGWGLLVAGGAGLPLWGAVDATLRRQVDWDRAGHSRTTWVALQGIGAPFGVGLVASAVYLAKVRRQVVQAHQARMDAVAPQSGAVEGFEPLDDLVGEVGG